MVENYGYNMREGISISLRQIHEPEVVPTMLHL